MIDGVNKTVIGILITFNVQIRVFQCDYYSQYIGGSTMKVDNNNINGEKSLLCCSPAVQVEEKS